MLCLIISWPQIMQDKGNGNEQETYLVYIIML